ncbi:MAG: glycosyltransferase family 2 protein [Bacteroidota bacterium]
MKRTLRKRSSKFFSAFLPASDGTAAAPRAQQLADSPLVGSVTVVVRKESSAPSGFRTLRTDSLHSSDTLRSIAQAADSPYVLLITADTTIEFSRFALERFAGVAQSTGAGLLFSNFDEIKGGERSAHPVADYQLGSVRDDFDFGPVMVMEAAALRAALGGAAHTQYRYAGLYAARLAIARSRPVVRIPESLYAVGGGEKRRGEEAHFAYVDPRNRDLQLEMEHAVTHHLKKIGAYIPPVHDRVNLNEGEFPVRASIVIPVRNRASTIADAVSSALRQMVPFNFNVIVVDNHSTDGTTNILRAFADRDVRVVHLIPLRKGLGIGGCWNEAVHHPQCGRFVAQLDSDDVYADESTLLRIVDTFYAEKCAMVVGSYRLTNMKLEELPPGLIDHREWTEDNGRNNALRVNGFGAPRAFFTPILRRTPFPDVSYGEDYAVGLAISREHRVGRIYDPIYLCRRWEGNTDANIDIVRLSAYNTYKDTIRTFEIQTRQRMAISTRTRAATTKRPAGRRR